MRWASIVSFSQLGTILSWGHVAMMEDILSITTWEKVLLASNGERTRMMLKVPQCPRGQHVCVLSHSVCLTLCDPMDCSSPGSSIHGMSQERKVEWVAIFSYRGSSQCKHQTQVSNPSLLHRQMGSLLLSQQGSPVVPKSRHFKLMFHKCSKLLSIIPITKQPTTRYHAMSQWSKVG